MRQNGSFLKNWLAIKKKVHPAIMSGKVKKIQQDTRTIYILKLSGGSTVGGYYFAFYTVTDYPKMYWSKILNSFFHEL